MKKHNMFRNKFLPNIIREQARRRLEEFRQYTLEIESKFNTDKNILSKSYDEAIKGLSEEKTREINEFFSEDYFLIEDVHIGMYRKSTVVSIYSFLENSINNLCRHLWTKNTYPIELDELRGDGIVRAKNYLEKIANVNFDLLNGEWSHLLSINKIRNCIVHSEGNVKTSKNSSPLLNIVANNPNLSLRNERLIKIEREYIEFSITIIEEFLDKLYQQVFSR